MSTARFNTRRKSQRWLRQNIISPIEFTEKLEGLKDWMWGKCLSGVLLSDEGWYPLGCNAFPNKEEEQWLKVNHWIGNHTKMNKLMERLYLTRMSDSALWGNLSGGTPEKPSFNMVVCVYRVIGMDCLELKKIDEIQPMLTLLTIIGTGNTIPSTPGVYQPTWYLKYNKRGTCIICSYHTVPVRSIDIIWEWRSITFFPSRCAQTDKILTCILYKQFSLFVLFKPQLKWHPNQKINLVLK